MLSAAEANLAAVAAAEPPTFASVIAPLMAPPHYKTNPLVCQSKFLAHCSTVPEVRAAAEAAGKAFAAFKAASRSRADVFAKVQAFAATAECAALGEYETHFVDALVADFKRGGLALSDEKRAKLQQLLDADAVCYLVITPRGCSSCSTPTPYATDPDPNPNPNPNPNPHSAKG